MTVMPRMHRLHIEAAKAIATQARTSLPRSILDASGRALYSPAGTLTSGSPVYFLGLNPGEFAGKAEFHDLLTVEKDLDRLEADQIDLHGYLDERWKGYAPGCAPIQVRGQQLFSILAGGDLDAGKTLLRSTPTSNLVLRRSTSEALLKEATNEKAVDLAQQCWPFHKAVIRETNCKVVLTHAVGIARALARAQGLGEGWQRPSGWGGALSTLYAWVLPGGQRLLAIPNLSRYDPGGARVNPLASFFQEFGPAA